MNTVEIKSDNYSVYIGDEVLQEFNCILEDHQDQYSKIFIFCDENSFKHCLPYLVEQVPMLIGAELIEIESGELNKTILICNDVWKTMSESNADRNAIFINLGGGVVCDMGGFIASLYKRGIRFFHIPTTLLSQVDASVGGKLAVDLDGLKNQIGVFRNPELVLIVPKFLKTLSERHWLSGMAEAYKHALISDIDYWHFLKDFDSKEEEGIIKLLQKSISIKNNIVLEDWKEKGLRKTLNFGHTIGHAIESQALQKGRDLLHGEAVSIGLFVESILSKDTNGFSQKEFNDVASVLKKTFPLSPIDENDLPDLIAWMEHDKKNQNTQINFTLLQKIGCAEYNKTCTKIEIQEAIKSYNTFLN